MNERAFDDLTRRAGELVSPPAPVALPRRGVLGLLGGGALAAMAGIGLTSDDAEAKKKKKNKKKKNKNKNKGKCKNDGQKCKKNKDCCDSTCSDGKCGSKCPTRVKFDTRWNSSNSSAGAFNNPWDITISKAGEVFVTDTNNQRVQVFDESGGFVRVWGSSGQGESNFQRPRGVGVNTDSSRVFVSDPSMNDDARRLRRFNTSGGNVTPFGRSQLVNPRGIAVDSNNRIWVVDNSATGRIFLFDSDTSYITNFVPDGSGALSSPQGVAIYKDGNTWYVYVTDTGNNRVVKYQYSGGSLTYVKAAGSRGTGSSGFNTPIGIAADSCGNLWVADSENDRIQVLDKDLAFKTRFTASFNTPTGVAFGTNAKTLFVVDSANAQVQKFALSS